MPREETSQRGGRKFLDIFLSLCKIEREPGIKQANTMVPRTLKVVIYVLKVSQQMLQYF